jgi:2-iminobutanoate/2-iminopropanoate deaminase
MKRNPIAVQGQSKNPEIAPAIQSGNLLFLSGIPGTKGFDTPPDFDTQARNSLDRLSEILAAAGSSLQHVIKVNCFLANPDSDRRAWGDVFREYFPSDPPARTTVGADLPASGALIEVDMIATTGA